MKNHCRYAVVVAIVCLFGTIASTNAQSTTFTYQGQLNNGANPANGNYDLTFALFKVNTGAGQVGNTITNTALPVSNGLFTVTLDFGTNFSGANRWLEIGVRSNGVGAFDTLTPRQLITATPYAITAGNLTGSLPVSQLTGALSSAQLSGTYVGTVNFSSPANSYAGDGGNLTNVNAALLGGLSAGSFWKLPGNAGTTAGTHFLGTTDNQPLELKVNNQRGLRIQPGTAPSFVAGSSNNLANSLSYGAAIGGGDSNRVIDTSPYGTIGGGNQNLMDGFSEGSTIGGGQGNNIFNSYLATIGGGGGNHMPGQAERGVIGGGVSNKINHSFEGTIGGGKGNNISGGRNSTISGGAVNQLEHVANGSIGGGWSNSVFNGADNSTIAGGSQNLINNAVNATIGGGNLNTILGTNSTIAGGFSNTVNALNSTIGGGVENRIYGVVPEGAEFNTISGGLSNSIQGITIPKAYANSIGGGTENTIGTRATHNTIGGGYTNLIYDKSDRSTIGGGGRNVLDADESTIAGGFANQIIAYAFNACSIGGGRSNLIGACDDATIGGGRANYINTDYSTISGGASNRITTSRGYATIPGGLQARTTHFGQLAYASGQFASAGDAQTSIHVCRGITTNSTPTELFLDGALRRMDMLENSTWTYDILVTGRTTAGDSAGYQIRGVIENNAGNTALVGTPDLTVLTEDMPAWNAAVTVGGNLTNALVIQVTGTAATTIRWVASVRTVEVTH